MSLLTRRLTALLTQRALPSPYTYPYPYAHIHTIPTTQPIRSITTMSSDSSTPIYEQSIAAMKKYLDSYSVDYKDCLEKSEIIARVKATIDNPNKVLKPVDDGKVGPKLVQLLGDKLQAKTGKFNTAQLKARVVALYFSAHWCGPCRSFTPVLKGMFNDLKSQGIEIVFVSSDQNEVEFAKYYGEMPWLALPFDERELKDDLSEQFRIQGIPSLIVLDGKTGAIISDDGRRDVMQHRTATNIAGAWLAKASKKA